MSNVDIDWLVDRINDSVRAGRSPEQAYKELCKMFFSDQVKPALAKFEEMTGRIRTLKEPTTLQERGLLDWYSGPTDKDLYWPSLYRSLHQRDWDRETIASLDEASTRVVSLLQPSSLGKVNTRGLVIGYVQSGKTANYSAVITKAADVGYKFFIVLSGLTNALRFQTQERLERELVDLNSSYWIALTGVDRDFSPTGAVGNVNAFLTEHYAYKVLCVVKKNATVLRRLLRWLRGARKEVLSNCPVLVIDDEADQASVNASEFEEKRTAINQRILEILAELPKAAYVGYTATPFANVFIDPKLPEDLYPRDFIVSLPKPKGYFGAERIFGREHLMLDEPEQKYDGLDMIRYVEDEEIPSLTPQGRNARFTFEPEITPSLEKALRYFWMATAARIARGDAETDSTMLIHTSLHIDVHELFREPVKNYRDRLQTSLGSKTPLIIEELHDQWNDEQSRVPSEEVGEKGTTFDELLPHLKDAIVRTDVIVENSKSVQRLTYGDKAKTQIVIGGNTLARGLTLRGLVVSFFVRATDAYDTLLQMGRWFGYRPGYADLPRIWMTRELEGFFYDLATVEQEIRDDIRRYEKEGMTPLEFGVRVRTHPALSITSRLKMQVAVDCDVSFRGQHPQTVFFKHRDQEWLINNINATKSLVCQIRAVGIEGEIVGKRYTIFRDVSVGFIFSFLKEYKFHEDSTVLQEKLLCDYIEAQNRSGELLKWNVVIVGRRHGDQNPSIDLGTGESVPLLTRSKYIIGPVKEYANLRAIVSPMDRDVDLNIVRGGNLVEKEDDSQPIRPAGTPGLLLIYPIDKDSTPNIKNTKSHERRGPLNAVEHIIGVSFVFPDAKNPTPQRYKTVDLSRLVREEPEWPEEEDSGL